ncbi:hypothetical protein KBD59_00885 [Candidatus Gracilibacteria bacterium]|nr:hypothetical protein [Candidatus Gracilibacteria bacterium]
MRKYKYLSALVGLSLILSGCLGIGEGDTTTDAGGFHSFATDEFRLDIPNSWEEVRPVQFTSDVPPNTLMAFRNNIKHPRYTATVTVIKNQLPKEVSTLDYSKALLQRLKQDLTGSKELGAEQVAIKISSIDTETLLMTLEGSDKPDAELKRYIHKAGVKNGVAYVVVGSYLPEESQEFVGQINRMVQSFEVR